MKALIIITILVIFSAICLFNLNEGTKIAVKTYTWGFDEGHRIGYEEGFNACGFSISEKKWNKIKGE